MQVIMRSIQYKRRTAMRDAYCDTEHPESHLTQSRIGVSAISRSGFLCSISASKLTIAEKEWDGETLRAEENKKKEDENKEKE